MRTTTAILFCLMSFVSIGQNTDTTLWDLERCIRFAENNNLQMKQQKLNTEIRKNIYSQSQTERLPSINAGGNYSYNMGRSVDRYTNEFSENNVQSTNFYVAADLNLFNGFQTENSIKRNKFEYLAALADNDKLKNDISLSIASAYLQILFNIEYLKIAGDRLKTTRSEVERIKNLTEAGRLAESNLAEILAGEANDELAELNARNQLRSSYLVLKQLLDISQTDSFNIIIPQISEPESAIIPFTVDELFTAAQQLPQIKSAEYRVKSYEKSLMISKGRALPKLSLSASYGTGYSDARKKLSMGLPEVQQIGYVGTTNDAVYTVQPSFSESLYPFSNQMKDNAAKSIGLQLTIPIFNKRAVSTDISNSRKYVEISKYTLQNEKNNLYKDIQTSYSDAESALSKFKAGKKSVEANKKAYELNSKKFELGMLSLTDYNTSKNNLQIAESNLLQAKFEYIFRMAILNFYAGKPISIQ